jgi:hypothetical protein
MTPADDIKDLPSGTATEHTADKPDPAPQPRRSVGPESEVRGGPEAPTDDDTPFDENQS